MSNAFTPGPWEVWKGHTEVFAGPARENESGWITGTRRSICEMSTDTGWDDEEEFDEEAEEAELAANARLIAAAPDLLAACRAIAPLLDDLLVPQYYPEVAALINDVIAKAILPGDDWDEEPDHPDAYEDGSLSRETNDAWTEVTHVD